MDNGPRERRKSATRLALHQAALRLALEHGPDRVTVESIADAADVSRRTFSNHFAGKEEAIFYGDLLRLRRLLDLVRERPADEPPRTALTRAATALLAESDRLDPAWVAQRRLLRGHPSLIAHQVAAYAAVERELAAELGPRGADELRSKVLAATFLAALRAATRHWLEHPDRTLAEWVTEALS
ncbi:AcrR family transcriptional regulator [Saccharothrix tamanrassetensis]|uniref:AcrR family transcriptional regulator n=1 Tax=Saccharothrix tamanrassetensis TaxID=1051531 RepID=A0A841CLP5_9PSEU|nr:TetR family transcriptional regulator [Saccharothrix tamanrassetensis]MBB5957017.1 AcrR family transcriptional regulator [Saccharothrix tamanrassetensis]